VLWAAGSSWILRKELSGVGKSDIWSGLSSS
jgi:hypothetical protein